MKLIALDSGRVTWLFPTEEFVPIGSGDGRAIIQKVTDRYNFAHAPQNPTREEIEKNGLKFGSGKFSFEGQITNIGELAAYNDGIVCIAHATEPALACLQDLMKFLTEEFGFRPPSSTIRKLNVSNVIVEFESSINSMLADYQTITRIVSDHLNATEKTAFPVQLNKLEFTQDRGTAEKILPKWILEARANVPLSQNRYFSSAATPTKQHLQMLQDIENLFTKQTKRVH